MAKKIIDDTNLSKLWTRIQQYINGLTGAFGSVAVEDIVPIVKGGTEADNAEDALANLGGFPKTGGALNGGIILPNSKPIQGTLADGTTGSLVHINASNQVIIGQASYTSSKGWSGLYGNDLYIVSKGSIGIYSPTAGLSNRAYGVNKVLWSGGSYMSGSQSCTLSEAISAQPHGIVLAFSQYNDGSVDAAFNYFFIPKWHAINKNGSHINCIISYGSKLYRKIIYVSDTKLTGGATNIEAAYTFHGQTVDNNSVVLRAVIGV